MSQTESTSDTDSNISSSSWIFVDEYHSDNELEKNKYYLNCSTEPIQELTPQCLNTGDQETDSDGISIISESDDFKEQSSSEEQTFPHNDIKVDSINIITCDERKKETFVKDDLPFYIYVMGWVLFAIITPLLLNYFTTSFELDNLVYDVNGDTAVKIFKEDVKNYLNALEVKKGISEVTRDKQEKIKRKYESKGEIDIHRLEYNVQNNNKKKKKDKDEINISKDKLNEKLNISLSQIEDKSTKKEKKSKNEKNQINAHAKKMNKKLDVSPTKNEDNSITKELKKFKDKKDKENKEKHRDEHSKNKKKKSKEFYNEEIKKLKKSLHKKDKELKELSKLLKIKDKQLKFLEYKVLKELNILRKSDSSEYKENIIDPFYSGKLNNSLTGDWYSKLHKGRTIFRNQQHASDWVFDRADFRNKKRNNKNNWYWNWMIDREQLRLKKGSRVYLY